jgi:hypothetical protein
MPTIHIPEYFRATVQHIGSISDDEFEALRERISALKPHVKPEKLVAQVDSDEDGSREVEIVQTLASLSIARLSRDASVSDFSRDVARSTAKQPGSKVEDVVRLEARLKALLDIHAISISARAFDVQHEYERVFHSARIVTDVRPLFDASGTNATGAMIVHNLKISYVQNAQQKAVMFALDDADLAELKKLLERAEMKSDVLAKLISKAGVPYFESRG